MRVCVRFSGDERLDGAEIRAAKSCRFVYVFCCVVLCFDLVCCVRWERRLALACGEEELGSVPSYTRVCLCLCVCVCVCVCLDAS